MPENMKSLNGYGFDAAKLNGKPGSEYASAESLSQLKGDLTGLKNGGVTAEMLDKNTNYSISDALLDSNTVITESASITGYDTGTLNPTFRIDSVYEQNVYKVDISKAKITKFPYTTDVVGVGLMLLDSDGKRIMQFSASGMSSTAETWFTIVDNVVCVDYDKAVARSSNAKYILFPMLVSNVYCNFYSQKSYDISEFLWLSYKDTIKNLIKDNAVAKVGEIVLPSEIPVASGIQLNMYYENILYNKMEREVFMIAEQGGFGGKFYDGVWQFTPDVSEKVWNYVRFRLYENSLNEYASARTAVNAFPLIYATGNYNVLVIGDSKIDNGVIMTKLAELFSNDSYTNVTFIGTRGKDGAKHEGRAGWYAEAYCTMESYNNRTNVFLNNGKFDFAHYMSEQSYSSVDCVCINLGTNDAIKTDDYAKIIGYYDEMINSIISYNPNIKILVGLAENMCQRKFVFSINKNRILGLVKALIAHYDTTTWKNKGVHLIPIYINQNLYLDYNTSSVAESYHSSIMIDRVIDETHQNDVGYAKNADMIYSAIKFYLN